MITIGNVIGYFNNSLWPPGNQSICSWNGVQSCAFGYSAVRQGEVLQITQLALNNGPPSSVSASALFPALVQLTSLTYLNVNLGSQLSGQVPDVFAALTALTHLELESNNLVGTLPPSLAQLPLNNLQMGSCLSGSLGVLSSMPLTSLYLGTYNGAYTTSAPCSGVTFSDAATVIPTLSSLTSLSLASAFSFIPSSLPSGLKYLSISSMFSPTPLPLDMTFPPRLITLSFYTNANAFSSFPWSALPKTLSSFTFYGNALPATPFPSAAIAQLTNLNGGQISGTNYTGLIDPAACTTLCRNPNLFSQLNMGNATGSCPPPTCLIECGLNNLYQYCPITWNGNRSTVCKTPANGGVDDPVQCSALVDFANATGWASWSANGVHAGWLSAASYCSWPGVTCAGASLQNSKLVVTNSSIVGFGIGPYSSSSSAFPNSSLVGTLPSTLGALTSLTSFYINLQQLLTGTIPSSLLTLKALTNFQLTGTGLTYPLNTFLQSVAGMAQLQSLYLDGYQAGGTWCPQNVKCPFPALNGSLTALYLRNLGLSGVVRSLPLNLTRLDLTGNPLIKTLSPAAALSALSVNGCFLNNISFSCLPSVLLNSGRCSIDYQYLVPSCEASPPLPPGPPGGYSPPPPSPSPPPPPSPSPPPPSPSPLPPLPPSPPDAPPLAQGTITWSGTYTINSTLSVNAGSTLVIQAGSTVLFNLASARLAINGGNLQVLGTVSQPVIFGPLAGTTGSLGGIYFSGVNFTNVIMQFASFTGLGANSGWSIFDVDAGNIANMYSGQSRPGSFGNSGYLLVRSCTFNSTGVALARGTITSSVFTNTTVQFYPWCDNTIAGFGPNIPSSCQSSPPTVLSGSSMTGGAFQVRVPFDHGPWYDYFAMNVSTSSFTNVAFFFDLYFGCRVSLNTVSIIGTPATGTSCSFDGGKYGMGDGGSYPFYGGSRSYIDVVSSSIQNCVSTGFVPWGTFTSSAVTNLIYIQPNGPDGTYSGLPMPMVGASNSVFVITQPGSGFNVAGNIDQCTFTGPGYGTGLIVGGSTYNGISNMNFGANGAVTSSGSYYVTIQNSVLQGFDTLLQVQQTGAASSISNSNLNATGSTAPLNSLNVASGALSANNVYLQVASGTVAAALAGGTGVSYTASVSSFGSAGAPLSFSPPPPAPPPPSRH